MYWDDSPGVRSDRAFDSLRIEATRLRIDVDHNWLCTGIGNRIGGRDRGQIRYDHFVARSDADSKLAR